MSLDDVVIIMSIPMRLILAIRHGLHQSVGHNRVVEPKGPPVVVMKRDLNDSHLDDTNHMSTNNIRYLKIL